MKKLKFMLAAAAAIGLSTASQATVANKGSTDFEEGSVAELFSTVPSDDESEIVAGTPSGVTRPREFANAETGEYVLKVSTGTDPLLRDFDGGLNNYVSASESPVYIDTLVQFTVTPTNDTPVAGASDKLMIYLNASSNLVVKAATYSAAHFDEDEQEDVEATNEAGDHVAYYNGTPKTVEPNTWYRLTVTAQKVNGTLMFGIKLDGDDLVPGSTLDSVNGTTDSAKLFPSLKYIPGIEGGDADTFQLTSVGFAGEGMVDDLSLTTQDPFATSVDFTLTWPAGYTAVSYAIGDGGDQSISGTSPFVINGVGIGQTVSFAFQNADGVLKTMTGTAGQDTALDASSETFTWADYLGDAVNGAYEIDNLTELVLFQKGVANTNDLTTANTTFKLTDDITLTAPWPGIGLQNGKDVYNTQQFNDEAFLGTFDGQNHTISGFQMVGGGLDYCGFFNSTYGATIQNLKIAYAGSLFAADTSSSPVSNESGATFVGVAKNSTLRNLTTVAGTVSCYKGFGGIVGYLTSGTLVDSCTNNVNMTSLKPNKCGGIAMITQGGTAVTISNCQNNGTIAGSGETGSLVGFVGLDTTITDCDSTVAYKLFHHNSGTVTVSGITADASVAAYTGAATPGLNFATVDNGVATFVADNALALNGEYKVMGPSAAYAFASAGSIIFDESLATPTVTADAAYLLTQSGSGTVTYTSTLAVAQVNSGAKYATLQAAVDAATAGDTVTTLADSTITTPLTITNNITVHNDHTIIGGVNYAICIGATVSFEGSGKIERASGITGSAFCVGANGGARGGVAGGTAGTLNFTGLTVCGGSGGNLIKLEKGTVNMNGGVLRDGLRGIKADADEGTDTTSTINIYGGTITITNTAANAAAVMASAESATGTATVTIYGGVITGKLDDSASSSAQKGIHSITIPGNSTAQFDADWDQFCAPGYETVLSDGWYVVTAVAPSGEEIAPGAQSTTTYATQAEAEAALANVTIAASDAITNALDSAAQADYLAMFEKKVVSAGEGQYKVEVALTAAAETVLQAQANNDAAEVIEDLSESTVTLTTTPGFYYSFEYGTTLDNMSEVGTRTLATGSTLTLTRPTSSGATAGFYKVLVNVAAE